MSFGRIAGPRRLSRRQELTWGCRKRAFDFQTRPVRALTDPAPRPYCRWRSRSRISSDTPRLHASGGVFAQFAYDASGASPPLYSRRIGGTSSPISTPARVGRITCHCIRSDLFRNVTERFAPHRSSSFPPDYRFITLPFSKLRTASQVELTIGPISDEPGGIPLFSARKPSSAGRLTEWSAINRTRLSAKGTGAQGTRETPSDPSEIGPIVNSIWRPAFGLTQ